VVQAAKARPRSSEACHAGLIISSATARAESCSGAARLASAVRPLRKDGELVKRLPGTGPLLAHARAGLPPSEVPSRERVRESESARASAGQRAASVQQQCLDDRRKPLFLETPCTRRAYGAARAAWQLHRGRPRMQGCAKLAVPIQRAVLHSALPVPPSRSTPLRTLNPPQSFLVARHHTRCRHLCFTNHSFAAPPHHRLVPSASLEGQSGVRRETHSGAPTTDCTQRTVFRSRQPGHR
jgi:hypothetical protein